MSSTRTCVVRLARAQAAQLSAQLGATERALSEARAAAAEKLQELQARAEAAEADAAKLGARVRRCLGLGLRVST